MESCVSQKKSKRRKGGEGKRFRKGKAQHRSLKKSPRATPEISSGKKKLQGNSYTANLGGIQDKLEQEHKDSRRDLSNKNEPTGTYPSGPAVKTMLLAAGGPGLIPA